MWIDWSKGLCSVRVSRTEAVLIRYRTIILYVACFFFLRKKTKNILPPNKIIKSDLIYICWMWSLVLNHVKPKRMRENDINQHLFFGVADTCITEELKSNGAYKPAAAVPSASMPIVCIAFTSIISFGTYTLQIHAWFRVRLSFSVRNVQSGMKSDRSIH